MAKTKKQMIEYLQNHFRYYTMNSWNRSTSYAANVKLHNIKFPSKTAQNNAYEILDCDDAYIYLDGLLRDFAKEHNYEWQVGSNGRSGGYLVLYRGGSRKSGHKSTCTECGQRNFTEATEQDKRCGRCGKDSRVNREFVEVYSQPGLGTDEPPTDFSEWSLDDVKSRYKLVREFDELVERCKKEFVYMAQHYKAVEREIMVPKKITVLVEK